MNKSVYLLRTNPALTTNVKLVINSDYKLYLESYNANRELSDKKYKKFKIEPDSFLSERLARFYSGLEINSAFEIKNDIQPDSIQNNFANQYDDIYWSGPRYIEDNRHSEEFQYNTTLKICPENLPKYFFIFRKDGTGADDNYINDLDFFKKLKLIKTFNLNNSTDLGKFLEKNFIEEKINRSPLELNFKLFEFSKWNGYNYYSGGNATKSFFLSEFFQDQNTYYELEKFLTNGFKDNGIISQHYLNLSYLFDDTVADVFIQGQQYFLEDNIQIIKLIQNGYINNTQYIIGEDTNGNVFYTFNENIPYRKSWTINRYTGFYINDIIFKDKLSTYQSVRFKTNNNIEIVNNVFLQNGQIVNPLVDKYKEETPIYLKIKNKFYLVEKNTNGQFVIVSDEIINGLLDDLIKTATDTIRIEYTNGSSGYKNYIKTIDNNFYYNNDFDLYENGVFIIKIIDQFYTLFIDNINKEIYINTDEYILANENSVLKKLGNNDSKINSLRVQTKDNNIIYFNIYLLEFTDIKDFDYDKTNTVYSRREYEKNNELTYFRPALYATNIKSVFTPKELYYEQNYNIYINDNGTITQLNSGSKYLLPLASEYAVSGDLYMLNRLENLTDIWNVNQYVSKWGINCSISNNSYAYKINNNLTYSGVHNFTSSIIGERQNINGLNLDYFFSIGQPINYNEDDFLPLLDYQNNIIDNIVFRTLNIDMPNITNNNTIHDLLKFDIDFYKNINTKIDYFTYILNQPVNLYGKLLNVNRISYVQESDGVNGNEIFFKGFNAYINYTKQENPNTAGNYRRIPATDLTNYGFSIIFTPKYIKDSNEFNRIGNTGIECIINKKQKNILINIYLCVYTNSYTTIDYAIRDNIYNTKDLYYSVYDNNTNTYNWVRANFDLEALTLRNIIKILESNNLTSDSYLDGISYTIIEDIDKYNISEFSLYNNDINLVKITLTEDIKIRHGDWIKLHNTSINIYDLNMQVVEVLNNKTFVIKVNTDQTNNISILMSLLNQIYLTNNIPIKPFEFEIKRPDEIKLDINRIQIEGNESSPVRPINNANLINDIVIDINNDGLIEHVYQNDYISRTKRRKRYTELNDNEIRQLPSIYRYSGDYEPILLDISLFNKNKNIKINENDINIEFLSSIQINNNFHIIVHINNNNGELDNVNIGDVINIHIDIENSNLNQNTRFLEYTTHNIEDINDSTILNGGKALTLSTVYDTLPFFNVINLNNTFGYLMYGYIFKTINSNILFDNNYTDFAINKNIIIAKSYKTTNPMRSIKKINDSTNKFPMIDEHGSTVIDKNIFKSPWDLEYYYETLPNKYKKLT